ncbi:deoxyuridine 5'-triphosphate nucleotidohydrolase [Kytococcus aerolatus]|uniref:dUTP diphosphatase n=1 Tax=Kytococcus aerolatus TaxID=592308 RepID=A0A212T3W9_9MICO|nr:dUTP diphosphatase [Kytococcus aerolatus]SNC60546.1 deoxyuridine 5'-triphosphate nucleotidohydrolase [Kytococcus aerolatus]
MISEPAVPLRATRLVEHAQLPTRAHPTDAGLDLYAAEAVTIAPAARALVGTGIALGLAPGTVGLVHPRSGLAARHGVTVLNAPGTVDAGYRGEVKVCLLNTDTRDSFTVAVGDRIAQLVIQRVELPDLQEVADADALGATDRSDRGHGSTGR